MKPRKTDEMKEALLKKGFRNDKTHHFMYWLYDGDKKTSVRTRISHGVKEYDGYLLGQVRRQMHLVGKELEQFFDCQLTGPGYMKKMKDRKHVA